MKEHRLRPWLRQLSRQFPGFVAHKRLLLKAPVNGSLKAVVFESSAADKDSFYIWYFVMPMCIPQDYISLLFGDRLRHPTEREYWTSSMPDLVDHIASAIQEQALPMLTIAGSPEGFINLAKRAWRNPHTPHAVASVLARSGRYKEALIVIDDFLPRLNTAAPAEKEIFDLSTRLRDLLIDDPAAALRQLQEWENYTIGKLGLQAYR